MKHRSIKLLANAVFLAALLAAPLGASAQTLLATADTNIRQTTSAAGTNYGTAPNISVRGTSSANNRYSYLQFNLSSLTAPITNATLSLTLYSDINTNRTASTLTLYGLTYATDAAASDLKLDSTLTNNNAPWAAVRTTDFAAPANATASLSTVAIPAPGEANSTAGSLFTFQSSASLVSFLESARINPNLSIVTLVIIEHTGQGAEVDFASKEHTTRAGPTLNITTTVVPEPATVAAIAGFATLALAMMFRRR